MAEELLGVGFEIHGGGNDLIFPHHENEAAQTRSGARRRARAHLDAQRDAPDGRREDGQERRQHRAAARRAVEHWGRDAVILFFVAGHYRQPIQFDDDDAGAGGGQRAARARGRRGAWRRARRPSDLAPLQGALLRRAGRRLQHARRRWPRSGDWVREANRREPGTGDADLREMLAGPRRSTTCSTAPAPTASPTPRPSRCSSSREAARAAKDFAEADRLRDELAAPGWEVRDSADGPQLVRVDRERRSSSTGATRSARRCAPAGARCTASGPRAARRAEPWLRDVDVVEARARTIAARAGTDAHQGVCAEVGPLPVRRRGRAARAPRPARSSRSTRSRTRRTSGRSAAPPSASGADGVVIPERRSAEVTPAVVQGVGGRRRAPADRPRAQPRRLPGRRQGRRAAGATARRREGAEPYAAARLQRGRACSCSGAEGKGLRPRVAAAATSWSRCRCAATIAVAERQRRGGRAAVRDLAEARSALDSAP